MKTVAAIAAIAGGSCFALGIFAAGALTAVFFTNAEPVPPQQLSSVTSDLWVAQATRVDVASQQLERLPARPVVEPVVEIPGRSEDEPNTIDAVMTASTTDLSQPEAFSLEHLEWCEAHYRSYNPSDNTYRAYSGNRRTCVSPFLDDRFDVVQAIDPMVSGDEVTVVSASGADETTVWDHVQSCFSRYKSYRPEDNSYQPYGGGPREQCE